MVDWKDIDGKDRTSDGGLGDPGSKVAETGGVSGVSGSGAVTLAPTTGSGAGQTTTVITGHSSIVLAAAKGSGLGAALSPATGSGSSILAHAVAAGVGEIPPPEGAGSPVLADDAGAGESVLAASGFGSLVLVDDIGFGGFFLPAEGLGSVSLANAVGQGFGAAIHLLGEGHVTLRSDATISAGEIHPFNLSIYATPLVPRTWADTREHLTKLADGLNSALMGRANVTGVVTLQSDSTTTVITDPRIGVFSYIALMPETDNARQAISDVYVAQRLKGTATLVHSSSSIPDRRFTYVILGG